MIFGQFQGFHEAIKFNPGNTEFTCHDIASYVIFFDSEVRDFLPGSGAFIEEVYEKKAIVDMNGLVLDDKWSRGRMEHLVFDADMNAVMIGDWRAEIIEGEIGLSGGFG